MFCKDKELIINGKAVRSPEQQIYKNMEDIAELKTKLQTWYASSVELNDSDNTILRSNTNVPDDVSSGLLIDPVGKMFSITGGDDTTLLITFYANVQGPQGEQGTPGASSNDKGAYITHVEPTEEDDIYILSIEDIDNISSDNIPVQLNDLIIYIDSNDEPTYLFLVSSINDTTLSLTKTGSYSKGKKLYLHNIVLRDGTYKQFISFIIINNDSTPFTISTLTNYIYDNFNSNHLCPCSGSFYYSSILHIASGFYINETGGFKYIRIVGANSDGSQNSANQDITTLESFLLNETVISLN